MTSQTNTDRPAARADAALPALRRVWDAVLPLTAAYGACSHATVARWAEVQAARSRCRYLAAHDADPAAVLRAHARLEAALTRAPRRATLPDGADIEASVAGQWAELEVAQAAAAAALAA